MLVFAQGRNLSSHEPFQDCPLPAIDVNAVCESNVFSLYLYCRKILQRLDGSQTHDEMPSVKPSTPNI